jgi:hypothetical protein
MRVLEENVSVVLDSEASSEEDMVVLGLRD